MEKINGYAKEEAAELVQFIADGRKEGRTLTSLFTEYGTLHCRASGSVRNYYYKLLKTESAAAKDLLQGKNLQAERIQPFTEQEQNRMLQEILIERGKGYSVRRSIANVCGADEKKRLRYQNKYRNMLKKQPGQIRAAAEQYGIAVPQERYRSASFLERRLKAEIDELYSRLAISLRDENARLREQIRSLTEENALLRASERVRSAVSASEQRKQG